MSGDNLSQVFGPWVLACKGCGSTVRTRSYCSDECRDASEVALALEDHDHLSWLMFGPESLMNVTMLLDLGPQSVVDLKRGTTIMQDVWVVRTEDDDRIRWAVPGTVLSQMKMENPGLGALTGRTFHVRRGGFGRDSRYRVREVFVSMVQRMCVIR